MNLNLLCLLCKKKQTMVSTRPRNANFHVPLRDIEGKKGALNMIWECGFKCDRCSDHQTPDIVVLNRTDHSCWQHYSRRANEEDQKLL